MAEFEVERVGGELKRFGVEGAEVPFEVVSPYEPAGSQPKAIESLVQGVRDGDRYQVLLGVTGSGKTFTAANVIAQINKPTLVLSHNKTLAAQLYGEFRNFFPERAQRVLSQQRCGLLRLVLRLLSARSVCAAKRYIYRERLLD